LVLATAGCSDADFNPDGGEALGAAFVASRGCATCHQSGESRFGTLSGQDTARPDSTAFGANLTPDRETGIGGWADLEIIRALRAGVDDQGDPLCPPMPQVPEMSDLEAHAIVAYLRSLPPVAHAIPASKCPPVKPRPPADMASGDLAMPILDGALGD
jgi:mono/diheme cytochrome c family protein